MGEREYRKDTEGRWSSSCECRGQEMTWQVQRTQRTSICLHTGRCGGVVADKTREVGKGQINLDHLLMKGFLIHAKKSGFYRNSIEYLLKDLKVL